MFDKSNRYIYFLSDFVGVGFIRLFQIFQYSDISACPEYIKGHELKGRMRQHISELTIFINCITRGKGEELI
jgi:hypothetical protein